MPVVLGPALGNVGQAAEGIGLAAAVADLDGEVMRPLIFLLSVVELTP